MPCYAIAITMSPQPDPEHVGLLVELIASRKRFPRTLAMALLTIDEIGQETTDRIFFDCGGSSTWASWFLTKRSLKNNVNIPKKARRLHMVACVEQQDIEARRGLARQVATALEPERKRIEDIIQAATIHARRKRPSPSVTVGSAAVNNHVGSLGIPIPVALTQAPGPQPVAASPAVRGEGSRVLQASQAPQGIDLRNPAQYFAEPWDAQSHAVVSECTSLFPPYLAGAIRRHPLAYNADVLAAAVSIMLPHSGVPECLMKIEVVSSKLDHIAQELFGAHLEAEEGCRYVYLQGGSKAAPDLRLGLRDCRLDRLHHFFGDPIADAIRATPKCQRDVKEGHDRTSCVSMSVPSAVEDTGIIYALLCQSDAAWITETLFH